MHLLPPSPSLPTLCPSVAQRLELGWAVIHSPGTHSRLDAAGLDPLPAGLVYDQGTEAPVPSPSWRQIIASFKCILSVEGNSFSGCRQSACAELIVTVALISIPAHPRSFPPSGMAGVQVRAWARCQGHPRYPNRSRAWPESSRVPSTHLCLAAERRGVFLGPPRHTTLICHQRIPTAKRKEPAAGGLCHELGPGAKLQTKPSCFCPPGAVGGSGCPSPAGSWVRAGCSPGWHGDSPVPPPKGQGVTPGVLHHPKGGFCSGLSRALSQAGFGWVFFVKGPDPSPNLRDF